MKKILVNLFAWLNRVKVLREQVRTLTIQNGVLMGLLENERRERDKLAKLHERNQQGTTVLLKFIHASHHLDVPFAEGSIREAIQKGMNENAR